MLEDLSMADQPNSTSPSKYLEAMSFVRIFRTFRMAVAPGKLGLALLGLLLMGFAGWLLDRIWPTRCQPVGEEIAVYWKVDDLQAWRTAQREIRLQDMTAVYRNLGLKTENLQDDLAENPNRMIKRAADKLEETYQARKELYEEGLKEANGDKQQRAEVKRAFAAASQELNATHEELKQLKNRGVFESFAAYELDLLHRLINAACRLNFLGEFDEVINGGRAAAQADMAEVFRSVLRDAQKEPRGTGGIPSVVPTGLGVHVVLSDNLGDPRRGSLPDGGPAFRPGRTHCPEGGGRFRRAEISGLLCRAVAADAHDRRGGGLPPARRVIGSDSVYRRTVRDTGAC